MATKKKSKHDILMQGMRLRHQATINGNAARANRITEIEDRYKSNIDKTKRGRWNKYATDTIGASSKELRRGNDLTAIAARQKYQEYANKEYYAKYSRNDYMGLPKQETSNGHAKRYSQIRAAFGLSNG